MAFFFNGSGTPDVLEEVADILFSIISLSDLLVPMSSSIIVLYSAVAHISTSFWFIGRGFPDVPKRVFCWTHSRCVDVVIACASTASSSRGRQNYRLLGQLICHYSIWCAYLRVDSLLCRPPSSDKPSWKESLLLGSALALLLEASMIYH